MSVFGIFENGQFGSEFDKLYTLLNPVPRYTFFDNRVTFKYK